MDPIKLNESWALLPDLYNPKDPCIEIKINGNSLLHQLTYLSCRNAKSPSITTDFGHSTVFWLAKELDIRRKKNNPNAMLFCCIECDCSGCSTPICEITQDTSFVYWTHFRHNHREETYPLLRYCFDRESYYRKIDAMKAL